ncbi:MAG: hypothetical protein LBC73_06155 [Oscillospiraceae bacterium]|nr:hypothetical protein [Oscillospiraceae bacterium]
MKKMKKRGISLILTLCMVLALVPFVTPTASAYAGGNGTVNNPFLIQTQAQLNTFRDLVNSGGDSENTLSYSLVASNLTLSGVPIGTQARPFSGTFDGRGNTINANINVTTTSNGVGLFGFVGATTGIVKNVVVAGSVSGTSNATNAVNNIGGVVGNNSGTIENVAFIGSVRGTGTNASVSSVGGIAGLNAGTVRNSYNTGSVTGTATGTGSVNRVGGIVGENKGTTGMVQNNYNTGNVTGTNAVGGIVGSNDSDGTNTVQFTYNTGNVSATNNEAGGIVGVNAGTMVNNVSLGLTVSVGRLDLDTAVGRIAGVPGTIGAVGNKARPDMQIGIVLSGLFHTLIANDGATTKDGAGFTFNPATPVFGVGGVFELFATGNNWHHVAGNIAPLGALPRLINAPGVQNPVVPVAFGLTLVRIVRTSATTATVEFSSNGAGERFFRVGGGAASAQELVNSGANRAGLSVGVNTITLTNLNPGNNFMQIAARSTDGRISNVLAFSIVEQGWQQLADGSWIYILANGQRATGWLNDSGTWYFLGTNGIMLANSWLQSGGLWYYLGANGAMATNRWVLSGGLWYYLGATGAMHTNAWIQTGGIWYYVGASGAMVTNTWVYSGGAWYYLGASGAMAVSTTIGTYRVGADGRWIP